ncbi:DUF2515 family protein [Paraherbaspirillum soli]|uniref:DUF2515 family protein n=1 Tax=Paraherbaspirillum soli TaxID=631222 RepID=A0ABW0M6C2_9BURK
MADGATIEAMTNDRPDSCVEVHCGCPTLWSMAQQFCYTRLSNKKNNGAYRLINLYPARARRISATYARMYLETEEHGVPEKKGRYYWMALGAFASKTVACTLETLQLSYTRPVMGTTVREGLGQGNFWLFMDIAAWHWFYSVSPTSFDQCVGERNTDTYVDQVKQQIKKLPWEAKSLPKIDHLKVKPEVAEGFALVRQIEGMPDNRKRQNLQLRHLMAMACHEQGNILQKLIYNDPDFAWWIKVQRDDDHELRQTSGYPTRAFALAASIFSPELQITFTSQCGTSESQLKNPAPKETKLEEYDSRMLWITSVADQFHNRMIKFKGQMESELAAIAGWVGTHDGVVYPDEHPPQ